MKVDYYADHVAAMSAKRHKMAQDAARTPDDWRRKVEARDAVIAVREETIRELKAENELLLLRIGELKLNKEKL